MSKVVEFSSDDLYFAVDDCIYKTSLYYKGLEISPNNAYIKGDYVYVFRKEVERDSKGEIIPGVYYNNKTRDFVWVEPKTDKDKQKYSVENVDDVSPDAIFKDIQKRREEFYSAEDIEEMNNNANMFTPTIQPDDDFLKKIIKQAIIDKGINLNSKIYKEACSNKWILNNLKSSLTKKKKQMSIKYFKIWCELLNLDFIATVQDNGNDPYNPLPKPISKSLSEI